MVTDKPQTPKDTQEHLAAENVILHRSTVQCTLHKEQLNGRVMQKKPFLRTANKWSPLRYAKAHLDKPELFWNNVLWTETKTEL